MKKKHIIYSILILGFFLVFIPLIYSTYNSTTIWSTDADGVTSSLALDSNGIVHLAFRNDSSGGTLYYCNNSLGSFICSIIDSNQSTSSKPSIAIDSNDKVHIVYSLSGIYYAFKYCNNTLGSWTCEDIGIYGDDETKPSIAIDTNNKIHVSFLMDNVNLSYCNNTLGSWTCAYGVSNTISPSSTTTSIALDKNNKVYIIASNDTSDAPYVCDNSAGAWSCLDVPGSGKETIVRGSIAMDSNNYPHISFNAINKLVYCNKTSGSWTCVNVTNDGHNSNIVLDANNNPYITQQEDILQRRQFCNNTNTTWMCNSFIFQDYSTTYYYNYDDSGFTTAIKKGRIVDTTSYSQYLHTLVQNLNGFYYINQSLPDTTPPYFTTIPANASLFYGNQSLLVKFTGTDEIEFGYYSINDTRFLINQTGFLSNATPIAVGNYEINVTINDSVNYINWTRYKVQINKSMDSCSVYFNATSPITFPNIFKVYTDCTSLYTLYKNGTSIANGSTINSGAGYYNFTVQRTDNINYTNTVNSQFFTVTKSSENCQILFNETSPLEYLKTFKVWNNCTTASVLARNGTTISNNSEQSLGIGAYNFSFSRNDTANYSIFYNETQFRIVDTTPPVSVPTMTSPPSGATYTNNTWTKDNVQVTISASDVGIGYNPLSFPVYCTDTTNTCEPNTFISSGAIISTENITYIRFYSNDTLGNKEITQFRTIKVDKTSPTIKIHYPTENLNLSYNTSIPFNFTVEDSYSGVGYCLYSLDGGGTNNSISCNANTTIDVPEGTQAITFFVNDSVNNWNNTKINFKTDLTNPLIIFGAGVQNNTYKKDNFISTNVSVTETNEKNITFDLYFSNYTITNSSTYTDGRRIINWTNLLDGIYYFNVTIFDYVSHSNNTETYKITLDKTNPSIFYNPSSDANQTFRNSGWIFINISASDINKDAVRLDFNGINETFDNNVGDYYWENKTGLTDGNYSFYTWENDSAGNINFTSNYTVIIDLTNPVAEILLPQTATYNYNTSLPLNFSITETNLDKCWYNLDDTANITIDCSLNVTFNTSENVHTLYLFANDSSGREGSDTVTFTVSLAPPGITLNYPTNGMWWNTNNVYFNYTPSDASLDVCEVWTNTTGVWNLNYTDTSPTTDVLNNLSLFVADGRYIWNVWCNDSGGSGAWADAISNHTYNVDSTYPIISYGIGVINDTNTTKNFISTNVSVTETNEKNITFDLYFSNYTITNSSTYTDGRRIINWTNLLDGIYYFNVTIFDYASNSNKTSTYLIRLDDTAPIITINNPLSQNYGTNDSMTLNYTITDNLIGVDTCWYYIYFTNGTLAKSTEILTSCVNDTFTLPGGDNNFTMTLFSKDLLSNTQVSIVTFGIRTESPVIVLSPTTNTFSKTSLNNYFNFTVSTNADNISICQLWTNTTGIWHLNQTKTTVFYNGTKNVFNPITIPEGVNIWNVWCNDSFGYSGWALNNNTYTVDLTYPALDIITINTPNSQTFTFNVSVNDTNLDICKYSIINSTGEVDGLNNNVSFTCNALTSATVSAFGSYTLLIFSRDEAHNENTTQENFTLSAPPIVPSPGPGPSSIQGYEIAKNFTIVTINFQNNLDLSMAKDSKKPRTKTFYIINKGVEKIQVKLSCSEEEANESSKNISICKYVKFSQETYDVSPNEQNPTLAEFKLTTPENVSNGERYYFNIIGKAEEEGVPSYAKLSVSSKVGWLALIHKWSYVGGKQSVVEGLTEAQDRIYPVWVLALIISLVISIILFVVLNKIFADKGQISLAGFFISAGIFVILFFLFLGWL